MKEKYIPAVIEIFMFEEKQIITASSVEETTQALHDNAFRGFEELL